MENKQVVKLQKEITPIISTAMKIEIVDEKSLTVAVEKLSQINKYLDQVTKTKETVTKPLNFALKAARELFKPLESSLGEVKDYLRHGMTTYQTEKKRIEDIEANKIENRIGEGKGKLKFETAVKKIEDLKTVDNIKSDSGSVKFKTVEKFEVEDISKLPIEYILANEVLIRQQMLKGVKLPGVRYFLQEIPINRR